MFQDRNWFQSKAVTSYVLLVECDTCTMLSTLKWDERDNEQSRTLSVNIVGDILTRRPTDADFKCTVSSVLDIDW